jgi:ClpP class serine protease
MDTRKPVTAVTDGMAASAAYGIMSAASRRLITQDATVGSIGVRLLHVDQVKYNDVQGVTVTEFFAGARKVDFSPHEALTEEKRAALQALVDAFYGIFTGAVARHLGVTQQFVRDTEAGLFVGRHAIDRSLAHAISTLDAVLASPAPARTSASGASQTRRSIIMSDIATVADLEATYPALVAQIRADASESAATATAAAQQAERSRIREILDLAPLGCEALAATCCFTTPVSASDAAKQFLAHQKTLGPERLAQLRADAPAPVRPSVESDDQEGKEAQTALRAAAARRNHAQQQRQLSVVTGRRA